MEVRQGTVPPQETHPRSRSPARPSGGHLPPRIHLRRRQPAPGPAVEHSAGHPGTGHRNARPRRPGPHFHPL